MEQIEPEKKTRKVIDECADCDICRFLMDADCLFFPELYRLYDQEIETGEKITSGALRNLVDMCNFCALCPCPPVRANIIEAKTRFIDRDGLRFGVRTLEDVARLAKLCGAFPRLNNKFLRSKLGGDLVKKAAGIHPERNLPVFPANNFPAWAKKQNLNTRPKQSRKRKIAYFAGCTANYLFPEVAEAAVDVLRINGVEVYYPDQQCCGMPSLLEGDRLRTLQFARTNVDRLAEAAEHGYDIVCSCPTCGFMLKNILGQGAYYSPEYQASVGRDAAYLQVPVTKTAQNHGNQHFAFIKKSIYGNLFKDDGYFSSIDPLKRIMVAENTLDLGEYLLNLHRSGVLKTEFAEVPGHMVYYPPCHLREQNIGRPYLDLLQMIPDQRLNPIDGALDCCGMAGIMGFKKDFHKSSVHLGKRLMEKIKHLNPERLITDCLSCRLQFRQLLPYQVVHPVELLKESYANCNS
jgi:glycerol-3-phosphate dehydrogenase subunit C